jgi:hypothetical protein
MPLTATTRTCAFLPDGLMQDRTRVRVYEAKERVQVSELPLQQMIDEGYRAWRYRGMHQ